MRLQTVPLPLWWPSGSTFPDKPPDEFIKGMANFCKHPDGIECPMCQQSLPIRRPDDAYGQGVAEEPNQDSSKNGLQGQLATQCPAASSAACLKPGRTRAGLAPLCELSRKADGMEDYIGVTST
jgi:hypothetical protein